MFLKLNSNSFAYKFSRFKTKIIILFGIVVSSFLIYFIFPYFNIYRSIVDLQNNFIKVEIHDGKANYSLVKDQPEQWAKIKDISKRLQWAIIASEDGKFFEHNGFDYDQFQDAFRTAFVLKKKKIRGASTITQQLVKNLYLDREKSVARKAKEFIFSLVLENHVEKKKILETYLNIIEYGKNIYGIKSASNYYFRKNPSQLTARESAFLAMLLPSPIKYARSFQNKRLTPFAIRIVNSVLIKMNQVGAIGPEELQSQTASSFFWESAPPESNIGTPNVISEENLSEDNENE